MSKYVSTKFNGMMCACVGKHVPLPVTLENYEGNHLCPTTYNNVLEYKKIWEVLGNEPPGSIRKHFSEFVQDLVRSTIDKSKQLL
jgi:hypothetical protein